MKEILKETSEVLNYRKKINRKYIVIEGVLDSQTIKQTMTDLKKNKKFEDLKKYYDTVRKDLIDRFSLSLEEASSVINYAIHH